MAIAELSYSNFYRDMYNISKPVFYFNRINVPRSMRKKGIGEALLKAVLEYAMSAGIVIINDPVSSGEMGQLDLIRWYMQHGFVLSDIVESQLVFNLD